MPWWHVNREQNWTVKVRFRIGVCAMCIRCHVCACVRARVWMWRWMWMRMWMHISLGRYRSCQHGAFSGVGSIVASFVSTECPKGRGMWGIFGKPLKRAIWNTPGLHAVLTTCVRFLSVSDDVCAACCPLLLTGTHHVCLQIHATCCCLPRCTTETFGAEKSSLKTEEICSQSQARGCVPQWSPGPCRQRIGFGIMSDPWTIACALCVLPCTALCAKL